MAIMVPAWRIAVSARITGMPPRADPTHAGSMLIGSETARDGELAELVGQEGLQGGQLVVAY